MRWCCGATVVWVAGGVATGGDNGGVRWLRWLLLVVVVRIKEEQGG